MKLSRVSAIVGMSLLLMFGLIGCMPGAGNQQQRAKVDPVYSPDGSQIAFVATHDGDPELYVADADGSNVRKLTDNESVDASPSWAPDGSHIIFVSDRDGEFEIYTIQPDGSDARRKDLVLPEEESARSESE
ncbi:MAG: TolB family protein [Spirochaetota bacterium]